MERIGAQRRKTAEGSPPGEHERVNLQERLWLLFDDAKIIPRAPRMRPCSLCPLTRSLPLGSPTGPTFGCSFSHPPRCSIVVK